MSERDQDHESQDTSSLPPSESGGKTPSPVEASEASMMAQDMDIDASEEEDASQVDDKPLGKGKGATDSKISGQDESPQAQSDNQETPSSKSQEHDKYHHYKRAHFKPAPDYLNEETLEKLKDYLRSEKMDDTLDEDAIAVRILKTDRMASDRARFHYDLFVDSDEEQDDIEVANRRAYQAAEEYTLALDFYKKAVAEAQPEDDNAVMDKRTLNWLRKAMGLHRRNEISETTGKHHGADHSDESEEETEGKGGSRRVTRGLIRSTRIKRRAERASRESKGLDALMTAVEELEEEFGAFPATLIKKKRKKKGRFSDRVTESSEDELGSQDSRSQRSRSSSGRKRRRFEDDEMDRQLIARLPESEEETTKSGRRVRRVNRVEKRMKITGIVIGGRNVMDYPYTLFGGGPGVGPKGPSLPRREARPVMPHARHRERRHKRPRRRKVVVSDEESDDNGEGRLFGEMDPYQVMSLGADDYIAESNKKAPISLSLLEWKRRQQWDPNENKANKASMYDTYGYNEGVRLMPPKLIAAGISATLPTWASVNPIPEMQRHPATTEPLRRRHSDEKYARWITTMINSLNSSARSWAFYEFFYSDIDRPWYNVSEFQSDIARLGISPTTKLTRKEWSLVRRSIRGRPRRFSKRFILSEMEKLNKYRQTARAIQRSEFDPVPKLRHDVPATIRVGATVTAFHSRFRVIHRGIVLSHDPDRHGYLVQFERPELGYQFCVDTLVASHGVPEILVQGSDCTLDGTKLGALSDLHEGLGELPYGTSYGTAYVDQVDPVKRDKKAKLALLETVLVHSNKPRKSPFMPKEYEYAVQTGRSSTDLIEHVAERESLVQLIGIIDAGLQRKNMILDAIEACHEQALSQTNKDSGDFVKFNPAYAEHYSWLQANLQLASQSLESALVYLQVMYANAYSGMRSAELENENDLALEEKLRKLLEDGNANRDFASPWLSSLALGCKKAALEAAGLASSWDESGETPESKVKKLQVQYLDQRLSAASGLLLNANYCSTLVLGEPSSGATPLIVGPMTASLGQALERLAPTPLPTSTTTVDDGKLDSVDRMRLSAWKEVQEALTAYETELAAMSATKKIVGK